MSDPRSTLMRPDQRRRLYALARRFGLTDDERHDLAGQFLGRDLSSWQSLTVLDAARLIDVLEGAALLIVLLGQRP